jgi:hypothetical protein
LLVRRFKRRERRAMLGALATVATRLNLVPVALGAFLEVEDERFDAEGLRSLR